MLGHRPGQNPQWRVPLRGTPRSAHTSAAGFVSQFYDSKGQRVFRTLCIFNKPPTIPFCNSEEPPWDVPVCTQQQLEVGDLTPPTPRGPPAQQGPSIGSTSDHTMRLVPSRENSVPGRHSSPLMEIKATLGHREDRWFFWFCFWFFGCFFQFCVHSIQWTIIRNGP